jgi:aspartyl-tRNA(Asn)/glutamyl-tRNA(Gln) amidotransferase subunit A
MKNYLAKWKRIYSDTEQMQLYTSYVREWDERINAFIQFDPGGQTDDGAGSNGLLRDVPFAVKDNIAVRGFNCTCGSNILKGLRSPYTATAVRKLQDAGARVVGKTNLDEFGMGSSNENSAFGATSNPWDSSRVTGGSSGGSAAAVAAGLVPFALGSDTGGSVRQPAAFCGVYGLKPTYGSVSRYGLTAYASSLEVIGILAAKPEIIRETFDVIKGQDPMDHSSLPYEPVGFERKVTRIGVLPESMLDLQDDVMKGYRESIRKLQDLGYTVSEIDIPALEYTVYAYYTIATAEASANLARYNGIRYGLRDNSGESYEEMLVKSRSRGFGDEVKLRVLLGTYVLRSGFQDQYYIRAQKIRTAIRQGFERAFGDVDLILQPVFPAKAFLHGSAGMSPLQQKLADNYTGSANLAGIPALAFPVIVENGLPVGMQLLAPPFEERLLFQAAEKWQEAVPAAVCPGVPPEWS